jgi:integrase/recombinase XerC
MQRELLPRKRWAALIAGAGKGRAERLLALRDEAICAMILVSGVRCSEVAAVDLDSFDRAECAVMLPGGRRVLIGSAAEKVEAYLDARPQAGPGEEAPLFASRKGGRLSPGAVRRLVRAAAARAGVDGEVHPRLLRRTAGREMLRQAARRGWSREAVAAQLGLAHARSLCRHPWAERREARGERRGGRGEGREARGQRDEG